jgi:peptidoglycan hydrolase-like protein with peptidoglycan-binding domain
VAALAPAIAPAIAPARAPARARPATAAPESTGADIESRLRTLKKLYDQGLITDREYYEKRKQLLLGMFPAEDDLKVRGGKPTAAVREVRSGVAGEMRPEKKPPVPESFVKSGEGVVALGGGPQEARRGVVDRGSRGYIDRGSRAYIKWVQRSLNQILGTRLDVDGVMGRRTRNVIRSFQRQAGLGVDGVLGLQTEDALIKAGASPPRPG